MSDATNPAGDPADNPWEDPNFSPEEASDLRVSPGDVLFMSARSVANPGFEGLGPNDLDFDAMQSFTDYFGTEPGYLAAPGLPSADSVLVLSVEEDDTVIGVRLGVMSTDPVANHLPALAKQLSKPKVFFIGGHNQPVVLGVGFIANPMDAERAEQNADNPAPLFGKNHQFLHIQTGDASATVEEQVQATGSELAGLRLFHSFVTAPLEHIQGWHQAGLIQADQATFEDVFATKPTETWRQIMARRPFPENLFSTWAQNPERN